MDPADIEKRFAGIEERLARIESRLPGTAAPAQIAKPAIKLPLQPKTPPPQPEAGDRPSLVTSILGWGGPLKGPGSIYDE